MITSLHQEVVHWDLFGEVAGVVLVRIQLEGGAPRSLSLREVLLAKPSTLNPST
jgi:hypothetical protein